MDSDLVANGDKHYSPARIAGLSSAHNSVAESDEQPTIACVRRLQRRAAVNYLTRRFSPGYNISHLR